MKAYLLAIAVAAFCVLVYWAGGGDFQRGGGLVGLIVFGIFFSALTLIAGHLIFKDAAKAGDRL